MGRDELEDEPAPGWRPVLEHEVATHCPSEVPGREEADTGAPR